MNTHDPMAAPDGSILGLDNVRLELPLAGLGSRLLAAVVDNLVLFLLLILWLFGGGLLIGFLGLGTGWGVALILVGVFLLQWGYFAILEIVTQGRTPGKSLLGLRVVSRLGGQPTVLSLLIRNFLRSIDMVTGVPMLVFDRRRRRLGDLVAGTLVLHQEAPEAVAAEPTLHRHPEGWNAREVAVVESFLRRAERLDPNRAEPMAEQLLDWIARRDPEFWNEVAPNLYPTSDPVARLRQVLQTPAQDSTATDPAVSSTPRPEQAPVPPAPAPAALPGPAPALVAPASEARGSVILPEGSGRVPYPPPPISSAPAATTPVATTPTQPSDPDPSVKPGSGGD